MRLLAALLLLVLPGCAIPICEKPSAMVMEFDSGPVVVFDTPNIIKLGEVMHGLQEGKCKLGEEK